MGRTSGKSKMAIYKQRTNNCGLVIAAVLAFLLAGSVAVLIWQMLSLGMRFDKVSDKCSEVVGSQMDVWKLYPGYFKSDKEQESINRLRLANINNTRTYQSNGCRFDCKATPRPVFAPNFTKPGVVRIPRRLDLPPSLPQRDNPFLEYLHHSCCTAGRRYVTPVKAKNLVNVEREVVQHDIYKQYFLEESCDQDKSCDGCTCRQPEPNIYTAVVYKDKSADSIEDMMEIDMIKLAGSCKCLNY